MKIKEDRFIKILTLVLIPLILLSIILDDILLDLFLDLRFSFLDQIFIFLSQAFTKGIIFIFVFLLLYRIKKFVWPWIFSAVLSILIAKGLKMVVARPRPFELYPFINNLVSATSSSFPSGHTTLLFAALPLLFLAYPKQKWLFFIIALILALSRVYLGVHYVSDILAGMFVGLISSMIILLVRNKMKK